MFFKPIILVLVAFPASLTESLPCQACHPVDEAKINIHLIPHSHDDVGWLKTVDQYYYGTHKKIHDASVQLIISSTISALLSNSDRRFVQVETAFFWKWWQDQNEELRQKVIDLANKGQLEFLGGGWTMTDEATTNYQSIIDQYTWGFRILNDTLGKCGIPKIGWQIDPFGHSREHASILTQMGFQGLILGRVDHKEKDFRLQSKRLEFIWRSSVNLINSNIFTTILPGFYGFVAGACFDIFCTDYQPIVDDLHSPDYNLQDRVKKFADEMDKLEDYFQTSHLLTPMGGDFNYQSAEVDYSNMDKLIKGFRGHEKYHVFYSTPSCYVKAVYNEMKNKSLTLTEKLTDFFPYISDAHSVWAGFFTSRPTLKRFERIGNNILQATKQMATFSRINGRNFDASIVALKEIMGVMQHHDAITGTEKQPVFKDYVSLLHSAIKEVEVTIGEIVGDQLGGNSSQFKWSMCLLANVSICEASQKDDFVVAVYNPLSRQVNHYVRLPVNGGSYKIAGPDGQEEYDIFDNIHDFDFIKESHRKSSSGELVFLAKNLPPMGIKVYHVEMISPSKEKNTYSEVKFDEAFGDKFNGFTIDGSGKLKDVTLRGQKMKVSQEFLFYEGAIGAPKASGAYVFRPVGSALSISLSSVQFKRGTLADEVLQIYSKEVRQIIRVYKGCDDPYIEFDWLVGDLAFHRGRGKEVITRFNVDEFANKGVFYTDSNGREQIKRKLNMREEFAYDSSSQPIASNYYPVTSKIVIKDEKKAMQVAVLTDRAEGGSSLQDGSIELMVHRRLPFDDVYGVGEALNEKEYGRGLFARGQHYFTFGSTEAVQGVRSASAFERNLAHRKHMPPLVLLSDISRLTTGQKLKSEIRNLHESLPENVNILSLEPWRDDTFLLRLEHTLENNEDLLLSRRIIVDLNNVFATFFITEIGETTLGANQWLDEYEDEEKFAWNGFEPFVFPVKLNISDPLKIELGPMQIRTFLIKAVKK